MRIALCDDQQEELSQVQALLADYGTARPSLSLDVFPFTDGLTLLESVRKQGDCDLFLLDVLMPQMSGIELAERLTAMGLRPYVIFLTTSPDFALDAFSVQARNYLLKPVTRPTLFEALDIAVENLGQRASRPVTISSAHNGVMVVPMESIVYAEGRNHSITYHLKDGRNVQSRTVREPFAQSVGALLESGHFIQPHQSFAVNMNEICRLSGQTLHLSNGCEIPLARSRLAGIKAAYIEFLSHQGGCHV